MIQMERIIIFTATSFTTCSMMLFQNRDIASPEEPILKYDQAHFWTLLKHLLLFIVLFYPQLGKAQKIDVPTMHLQPGECKLEWFSEEGRTYFVQGSQNLIDWAYIASIHLGDGDLLSTSFQCNSPTYFLRLQPVDRPLGASEDQNTADFDFDGLGNLDELQAVPQTSPLNPDTDGDRLSDGQERELNLNATLQDTDGNGILDSEEDPDGDGLSTLFELTNSTPTNPTSPDSDNDGLNDGVELALNLNPLSNDSDDNGRLDSEEDSDEDGVSNVIEQNAGSNPNNGRDLGLPPTVGLDGVRYEIQYGRVSTDGRVLQALPRDRARFPSGLPFSFRVSSNAHPTRTEYLSSPASIELLETQVRDALESSANEWELLGSSRTVSSFGYQTNEPRQITITPFGGFTRTESASSFYTASRFRLTRARPEATTVQQHFVEIIEESLGHTTSEQERQNITSEAKSFTLTIPAGGTKSSPYTVKAPLKNEVETVSRVFQFDVEIRDDAQGKWEVANELKIAKWEDAWVGGAFRENFIDAPGISDADRFRVRIDATDLPEEQRKFYISSKGAGNAEYNDNPTEIILKPDVNPFTGRSSGFVSKSIILVADTIDNKFNNTNASNDQTHIVALGSKVEFRVGKPDGSLVASLPVRNERSLHIAVKLLWQSGSEPSQDALDNISEDLKVAKEIYGQTGIDLSFTVTAHKVNLSGVDLSDGLRLDRTQSQGVLEPESKVILDAFATPNNTTDVVALYVDGELLSGATRTGRLSGIAISDHSEFSENARFGAYWDISVSRIYKGTFLLAANRNSAATFSHELGHVLMLPHLNEEKNLERRINSGENYFFRNVMTGASTQYNKNHAKDSKRFLLHQGDRMKTSQFAE